MTERAIWGERYAIFDEIASGGMATVYLAARLDDAPGVPAVVALKKLSAELAKQPEFVAMFLDEAHLAARIRHPNVVTTYELLRTREGLGIVMDLVIGESLVALLRGTTAEVDRLPLPVSAAIVVDALEGLHAAHEVTDDNGLPLGLIHRDVSPHNILVGRDGVARVIDFGIAKAVGRLQTTDAGVIKGKFAYMSPEQIRGLPLDRATDLYSAGIVLWEAIAGRKLFRAASNDELLVKRSEGSVSIPPPGSTHGSVPRGLERLVLRALENDPRDRFTTAKEMAAAVREEVVIADADEVADWVRERAGPRLEALEAGRRAILASREAPSGPRVPSLPDIRAHRSVAPQVDIPEGPLPVDGTKPSAQALPATRTVPPVRRAGFAEDLDLGDDAGESVPSSLIELAPILPAPVEVPRHELPADRDARPNVAPRVGPESARRRRSSGAAVLVGALVLAAALVGGALARGPAFVKAKVVASAARHGFLLTFDRVEPMRAGFKLVGANLTPVGCPSVTLVAGELLVELDGGLDVRHVSVPGFELTLRGPVHDTRSQVDAWWKARHPSLSIEGRAGHVLWANPRAPYVAVEALDVSLAVVGTPEPAIRLDTASLLVTLPRGHVGPWQAHLDVGPLETRVRLGFDASSMTGPPSATFIERDLEGATWSVDIPRASTFKVGVPADLFGLTSDLSLEVALRAHAAAQGNPLEADVRLGLYGLQLGTGPAPVDVVVSGTARGDPETPLPIQGGRLVMGKASSPVSGTLLVADDGVRVEIHRPAVRGGPPLVLDTREWTRPAAPPP